MYLSSLCYYVCRYLKRWFLSFTQWKCKTLWSVFTFTYRYLLKRFLLSLFILQQQKINNLVSRSFFVVLNIIPIGNNCCLKSFMYFVGKSYLIGSFPSVDGWFICIRRLQNAGDFLGPIPYSTVVTKTVKLFVFETSNLQWSITIY